MKQAVIVDRETFNRMESIIEDDGLAKFMAEAEEDMTLSGCEAKNHYLPALTYSSHLAKIVRRTIQGNGMVTKNTSATVEKKEPSPRGEGLNQTERSIMIQSTERHDKALKKLNKI